RRQDPVEGERHLWRERYPVRPRALGERALEILGAPAADAGIAVGGDVGALHPIGRLVPDLGAAGKPLGHVEAGRPTRRVAAVAAHDGIDQIVPALELGLRTRA